MNLNALPPFSDLYMWAAKFQRPPKVERGTNMLLIKIHLATKPTLNPNIGR